MVVAYGSGGSSGRSSRGSGSNGGGSGSCGGGGCLGRGDEVQKSFGVGVSTAGSSCALRDS